MQREHLNGKIVLEKKLNSLDKFVLDFLSVLNTLEVNYVLVSGYVSILFGRSRSSEDIDIFIQRLDFKKFEIVWRALYKNFECINTEDVKEAYEEYLVKDHALRFSSVGKFIPNMEVKFPKMELDEWTLENRKMVVLNKKILFVSPLELQIPFKLFLGSEKDIEDAKYLYNLFRDTIDMDLLKEFSRKLKIEDLFKRYLI